MADGIVALMEERGWRTIYVRTEQSGLLVAYCDPHATVEFWSWTWGCRQYPNPGDVFTKIGSNHYQLVWLTGRLPESPPACYLDEVFA